MTNHEDEERLDALDEESVSPFGIAPAPPEAEETAPEGEDVAPEAPADASPDAPADAPPEAPAPPAPGLVTRARTYLNTSHGARRVARVTTWMSLASGATAAVTGVLPGVGALAPPFLVAALAGLVLAAFVAGRVPLDVESPDEPRRVRFRRDVALNASVMLLYLAFLLLGLVELLTIPAALGALAFFGSFVLGFVSWFPAILFGFLALLAGAFLMHLRNGSRRPLDGGARAVAFTALVGLALSTLAGMIVRAGAGGLDPDRAVFVLASALIAAFVFVVAWTRMPTFNDVTRWMEHEESLHRTNILRNLVVAFLTFAAAGIATAILAGMGILTDGTGILGLFLATLFLLPATLNVGVRRFIAQVHATDTALHEDRKRARVILNAFSVGLMILTILLGGVTIAAFLAQIVGVSAFDELLAVLVATYPLVLALVLIPAGAAVFTRTRVASEDAYTERRKAVTIVASVLTVVLGFLGAFIGSGMALGKGMVIENAVLALSASTVSLLVFVQARALLPSVGRLVRDALQQSAQASENKDLREQIHQRMLITYVAGVLFVLGFVGYITATVLGVLPEPGSGIATDAGFFLFVAAGVVLLCFVVVRYFQSVNIDPSWKKAKEDPAGKIGKKRLSASELQKYIILGFSSLAALVLATVGILVQTEIVTTLGPMDVETRYATDFLVFALLVGLGPYGYYHSKEANRIKSIDNRFPDFLRDLAESQRAGMTLTEAVVTASKGNYGMLTADVRKMAAQIQWGVSFSDALERFAKRVKTPLIERTVSLVVQAGNAGGNVVDVLTAAADDAREIQQILKDRKQSMSIYVMIIYVAFFVFMGVVGVLNAQFLPEVGRAVSAAAKDGPVSLGGITLAEVDEQAFRTLFFHAAVVQGFGGGLVAGVMDGGKPQGGLKHAFVMVTLAYVVFRFAIGG